MTFAQFKKAYGLCLDKQQEAAVQAVDGPVLLLAVPGSGKTTVLVSRIGYLVLGLGVDPRSILTMTYTVSAARDMRQRFASFFGPELAERLSFRTINGVCSSIIRRCEQLVDQKAFDLLEDTGRQAALIGEICRNLTQEYAPEATIKAIQTAITYVKNHLPGQIDLNDVEVEGVEFPAVYKAYNQALRQRRLMDYDDQLGYAYQILRRYPQILQEWQRRYPYLCMDEAQDTSQIQHAIIGHGVGAGVEAAAVEAAVADADEVELRPAGEALGAHGHVLLDALDVVDGERDDIARRPAYEREAAVLVYVRADARVYAQRADVDGEAPVALYYIQRQHLARHELREVEEARLLLAEHADEVVARAAGEVRDGGVGKAGRAVYALVERAVAAAGVDAQVRAAPGLVAYLAHGVHGRAGDVYLKVRLAAHAAHGLVYEAYLLLGPAFARHGVYYKKMLHFFPPRAPPYM